jgi:parallel beta-helix repeat protein
MLAFSTILSGALLLSLKVPFVGAAGTITYIKADGTILPSTAPISTLDNVTYTLSGNIGSLVIERDNILFDGAGYVVQGSGIGGSGTGIFLSARTNVTIRNVKVRTFDVGIVMHSSSNCFLTGNELEGNEYSIQLWYSSSNVISKNSMQFNSYGVGLWNSTSNLISKNNITLNNEGFWLRYSSNNRIYSNNITMNLQTYDIGLLQSSNNTIDHNELISKQNIYAQASENHWDDGLEGNHWNGYGGVDSTQDGIGDTPYTINANDTDNYPLMGTFHSYDVSYIKQGLVVTLISNSTISNFHALASIEHLESRMIRFNVSGETGFGFIRIRIPHALMNETYNVTVDGAEPYYVNYTLRDNGTDRWVYFSYQHSTHEVVIVSEFPSLLIQLLFTIASLLAATIIKKGTVCCAPYNKAFYAE